MYAYLRDRKKEVRSGLERFVYIYMYQKGGEALGGVMFRKWQRTDVQTKMGRIQIRVWGVTVPRLHLKLLCNATAM